MEQSTVWNAAEYTILRRCMESTPCGAEWNATLYHTVCARLQVRCQTNSVDMSFRKTALLKQRRPSRVLLWCTQHLRHGRPQLPPPHQHKT